MVALRGLGTTNESHLDKTDQWEGKALAEPKKNLLKHDAMPLHGLWKPRAERRLVLMSLGFDTSGLVVREQAGVWRAGGECE